VRELRSYKYIASIHGTCTRVFSWGDHLWQGGTTYSVVDGPGGPSVAAVLGPGDHPRQQKFAVDGPEGLILGGPSMA